MSFMILETGSATWKQYLRMIWLEQYSKYGRRAGDRRSATRHGICLTLPDPHSIELEYARQYPDVPRSDINGIQQLANSAKLFYHDTHTKRWCFQVSIPARGTR